jgi:hypothetical protein
MGVREAKVIDACDVISTDVAQDSPTSETSAVVSITGWGEISTYGKLFDRDTETAEFKRESDALAALSDGGDGS